MTFVKLYLCKFGFVITKLKFSFLLNLICKCKIANLNFKIINFPLVICLIQKFALPL